MSHCHQFFVYYLQEANESGALRLAKNKLEKQLEDLTWRLQLEKRMRVFVSSVHIVHSHIHVVLEMKLLFP